MLKYIEWCNDSVTSNKSYLYTLVLIKYYKFEFIFLPSYTPKKSFKLNPRCAVCCMSVPLCDVKLAEMQFSEGQKKNGIILV